MPTPMSMQDRANAQTPLIKYDADYSKVTEANNAVDEAVNNANNADPELNVAADSEGVTELAEETNTIADNLGDISLAEPIDSAANSMGELDERTKAFMKDASENWSMEPQLDEGAVESMTDTLEATFKNAGNEMEINTGVVTAEGADVELEGHINAEPPEVAPVEVPAEVVTEESAENVEATVNYNKGGQEEAEDSEASVTYGYGGQDPPQDRTATVTYTGILTELPPLTQTVTLVYTSSGAPSLGTDSTVTVDGTAHSSGTAHSTGTAIGNFYGSAYAHGDWGTPRRERALMGELGPEIIVDPRTAMWHTVGDNGAEFVNVPKDAIIFNHLQTRDLLSHGYTHGRAHANGTALAGGRAYAVKGTYTYSTTDKEPTSSGTDYTPSTQYSGGDDGGDNGGGDSEEKTEELLDWIETKLDRLARRVEKNVTRVEQTFRAFKERVDNAAKAISKLKDELDATKSATKKYKEAAEAYANEKNISEDYRTKVKEGALDIETITDDDLKEALSKYKELYEKYLDAKQKEIDLEGEIFDQYEKRFELTQGKYEAKTGKLDAQIERQEKKQDIREEKGLLPSLKSYYKQQALNERKLAVLEAERLDLQTKMREAVKAGMDTHSEMYREMQEAIEDVNSEIQDTVLSQEKLNNAVRQYYLEKFNRKAEKGDLAVERIQYEMENIEQNDELREAKGKVKSLDNNKQLQKLTKDTVASTKKTLKQLRKEYRQFIAKGYSEDSEEAVEMQQKIHEQEQAVNQAIIDYVNLRKEALQIIVDNLQVDQDNINFKRTMNDQTRQSKQNKNQLREAQGMVPSLKVYDELLKANETERKLNTEEMWRIEKAMRDYLAEGGKSTDQQYIDLKNQAYELRRQNEQLLVNDEEIKKDIKDYYIKSYNNKTAPLDEEQAIKETERRHLESQQNILKANGELPSEDILKQLSDIYVSEIGIETAKVSLAMQKYAEYLKQPGHLPTDDQAKEFNKIIREGVANVDALNESLIGVRNDLKTLVISRHDEEIDKLDFELDVNQAEADKYDSVQTRRELEGKLPSVNAYQRKGETLEKRAKILESEIAADEKAMREYQGSLEDKEYRQLEQSLLRHQTAYRENQLEQLRNEKAILDAYKQRFDSYASDADFTDSGLEHSVNMIESELQRLEDLGKDADPALYDKIIELTQQRLQNIADLIATLRAEAAAYLAKIGGIPDDTYNEMVKVINQWEETGQNLVSAANDAQKKKVNTAVEKFNRNKNKFENQIEGYQFLNDLLEARQENRELNDALPLEEFYSQERGNTAQMIELSKQAFEQMKKDMEEYIALGGDTASDEYASMLSQLRSMGKSVADLTNDLDELDGKIRDIAVQRFNKDNEFYDQLLGINEHEKNTLQNENTLLTTGGDLASIENYEKLIDAENERLAILAKKREYMLENMAAYLETPGAKESDENYRTMVNTLNDLDEAAQQSGITLADLNEQIKAVYTEKFNKITEDFANQIGLITQKTEDINKNLDLIETRGHFATKSLYESLIANSTAEMEKLEEEFHELEAARNEAFESGRIEKYSEEWYTFQNGLDAVNKSYEEAALNAEKFRKEIEKLNWEKFDFLQEKITNIADEASFMIDLLGHKDLFDDKGIITDEGMASLGLYVERMNILGEQLAFYADEIDRVDAQLEESKGDKDLLARKQELLQARQDMILSIENEKESIRDLIKDGIEKELDALKELIDDYVDAMDSAKDLYDYQKKIKKQTKEIGQLRKRLAAYSGVTNEENKARVQKITVDLEEALEDLEETQYDHYISEQKKMLDDLYDQYEKILNARLDDIAALIQTVTNVVDANGGKIAETIRTNAVESRYGLTQTLESIWGENIWNNGGEGETVLRTISDAVEASLVNTTATVQEIFDLAANDILPTLQAMELDPVINVEPAEVEITISDPDRELFVDKLTEVCDQITAAVASMSNANSNGRTSYDMPQGNVNNDKSVDDNKDKPEEPETEVAPDPELPDMLSEAEMQTKTLEEINSIIETIKDLLANYTGDHNSEYYKTLQNYLTQLFKRKGTLETEANQAGAQQSADAQIAYANALQKQAEAQNKLTNARAALKTAKDTVEAKKKIAADSKTDVSEKEKTLEKKTQYLAEVQGWVDNLRPKLALAKERYSDAVANEKTISNALAEAKKNKESQKTIDAITKELDKASKEVESAKKERDSLIENWERKVDALNKAKEAVKTAQDALKKAQTAQDEAFVDYANAQTDRDAKLAAFNNAEAAFNKAKAAADEAKEAYDKAQKEIAATSGYASGAKVINSNQTAWTQEGAPETIVRKSDNAVLTRLGTGDRIYNALASERLWQAANDPAAYLTDALTGLIRMDQLKGAASQSSNESIGDITYNINIPIEHVQDYNDFVNQLRTDGKFERMVQSMTVDRVAGKSRLGKNKYTW